jgi:hypothetical protein
MMSRKAVAAVIATLTGPAPAMAFDTGKLGQGGTLLLDDLMPLIGKTAALKREVDQALVEGTRKAADVICSGMRFPGQWVHLGGSRVSPYTCDFGVKWLQIRATVRITDGSGRVYETITRAAMKNASRVSETSLTWRWTSEEPPDQR